MSQSKFQKKTDKWTLDTLIAVFDLYHIGFNKAHTVGSLLARADDKALRSIKCNKEFLGFIREAAEAELNMRLAERKARKHESYKIS